MNYCNICSKTFSCERVFKAHLISKGHTNRIQNKTSLYVCSCGKSFNQSSSLSRHKKKCKQVNPTQTATINTVEQQQMQMQIKIQQIEIEDLKKQISLLLDKNMSNNTHNDHSTNTTNHNNTTNNIETQNVIVVNSFGSENTEYLTDRIVSRLIQNGPFTCLPKIIEKIHFDPEHPENHNIKVTNQKNNYAKIIKDNKWVTTNKKQAIEKMIQNGYDILEEKYQDNKEAMNDFKKERFENFQHKYENNNKELMRTMRDEVDITLINGTDKIHR